ncbi:MAG: hypothetical protein LQ350_007982 [Teloschistes chrysophthalmus]|nr:MAG: hypothetical protein LQ350_007982 [Niorma chrysophthalma]
MLSYLFLVFLLVQLGITNPANYHRSRVAYFQDSDPNGNFIVALKIDENGGTVSSPVRTSTGGKHLAGLPLAISQDSVVVWQDFLFTTNAGDNTLSMFLINPNDPLHPQLVGKPTPTLGQTPVSVAYSPQHRMACATNGRSPIGVACFTVSRRRGLIPRGPLLEIPPIPNSAPNPPLAIPLVSTADIVFNPSSTALFVSVGSISKQPGQLYAFAVDRFTGAVSNNPVVTSMPNLTLFFSMNFLGSDQRMIVTNPVVNATGAAVFDIQYPSLKATLETNIVIPDQIASCWVTYIPQFSRYAYIIDAARPKITAFDPRNDQVKDITTYQIPPNSTGIGGVDTRLDRNWLYLLTNDPNGPKVDVFAVQQGGPGLKMVQSFDIFSSIGKIPAWQGLAIWPSSS